MAGFKVTPWEVEGDIDYDKLISQFGTMRLDKDFIHRLSKYGKLHTMIRRGFFFSHRDLHLVLDDYDKGKGFFLYTGIALGGPMHIGHLIPFIITKWFQDVFDVNVYIQIPNEEKFLARGIPLEKIEEITEDNIKDIAAVGFNKDKTFIFKNTEYAGHLYPTAVKVAKKITNSTVRAVFGFNNETNIGMSFYPAMQIVPTMFEKKRCLIPAGIDQDPYWRIQRDIAEIMGYYKVSAIHNKLLPPLTGKGKMSSSDSNTALFLYDDPDTVKNKIMKYAFSGGGGSVKEHREKGGNPDVDVAFQWLHTLFEEDDKKIEQIRREYKSGKMLTGELKGILIEKLNKFLAEHRKRKALAGKNMRYLMHDGKLAREMWKF